MNEKTQKQIICPKCKTYLDYSNIPEVADITNFYCKNCGAKLSLETQDANN